MHRIVISILVSCSFLLGSGLLGKNYAQTTTKHDIQLPKFQFIENKGQWEESVAFRAQIPGGFLHLHAQKLTYAFYDKEAVAATHHSHTPETELNKTGIQSEKHAKPPFRTPIDAHAFEVRFKSSNKAPSLTAEALLPFHYNYFLQDDPSRWGQNARVAGAITYQNLYPNIDLRFLQTSHDLKYEFVVHAGANPNDIAMEYVGAESLQLKNGHLYIQTTLNTIIEQKPYVYQIIEGVEREVPSAFHLSENTLSFEFPNGYDEAHDLIIDPVLIFSTYSGSFSDNWGNTATYDENGFMYSGGTVFGADFPITVGAYQVDFAGQVDILIHKYNLEGSALEYGTVLGGTAMEVPFSLVTDRENNLIIGGITGSADFPTTANAVQQTFQGGDLAAPFALFNNDGEVISDGGIFFLEGTDMFITILNPQGNALNGSTYLGGTENDGLNGGSLNSVTDSRGKTLLTRNYGDEFRGDVFADTLGNIFIASITESADFPTTTNAQQTQFGGATDGVLVKLSADASQLLWSTYWGGQFFDGIYSVKLDSANRLLIAGGTNSRDLPTTANALNPNYQGGDTDGYLAIFDPTEGNLTMATYIGTNAYDQVYMVDFDENNNPIVFGQTLGNYPTTPGVYTNPNSGLFIHKLSADLQSTIFSTAVGNQSGRPGLVPTAFLVNECGNIYLAGWGGNINNFTGYLGGSVNGFPVTADAFQPTTDGSDFYVMALSRDAQRLLYGTYIGSTEGSGDHVDGGTSRFDKRGIVYQSVCSCQTSGFPTTVGAFSRVNNGRTQAGVNNCNMASFKFDFRLLEAEFSASGQTGCRPFTVDFRNESRGEQTITWEMGDGTTFDNLDSLTYTFTEDGDYIVKLTARNPDDCKLIDVAFDTIRVRFGEFEVLPDTAICFGEQIELTASGGVAYTWSPAASVNDPTSPTPIASPTETTVYELVTQSEFGCTFTTQVRVEVREEINVDFGVAYTPECGGTPTVSLQNRSSGTTTYIWDMGDGNHLATEQPRTYTYAQGGTYTIKLRGELERCYEEEEQEIVVEKIAPPNVITPNGDNHNDTFVIGNQRNGWQLAVYNRWGEEVYQHDNYDNSWGGENLTAGQYLYLITSPTGETCRGWVLIMK